MSVCKKYFLLLWKNWILLRCNKTMTSLCFCLAIWDSIIILPAFLALSKERHFEVYNYTEFDVEKSKGERNVWHKPYLYKLTKIAYSPCGNEKVVNIMKNVEERMKYKTPLKLINCLANAWQLEQKLEVDPQIMAGVQFDDSLTNLNAQLPRNIDLTLRFPGKLRVKQNTRSKEEFPDIRVYSDWQTHKIYPSKNDPNPREHYEEYGASPMYYDEGFLALQHVVSVAIIEELRKDKIDAIPSIFMKRFPNPPWVLKQETYYHVYHILLGICAALITMNPCAMMVEFITSEKETQIKQYMEVMGLSNWLHWMAWFTITFVLIILCFVPFMVIVKFPVKSGCAIYQDLNFFVILVTIMAYTVSITTCIFAVSVCFNKAETATVVMQIIAIFMVIPFMVAYKYEPSLVVYMLISLFPCSALCVAFIGLEELQSLRAGQFSSLWKRAASDQTVILGYIILMLVVDAFIFFSIATYMEAVFPGEFGSGLAWNFPFQKKFWCSVKITPVPISNDVDDSGVRSAFEQDPPGLEVGIQIRDLQKSYGEHVVVQKLNLNMYHDQITVLLGHNGTGKTTTVSMLCGFITPSGGTATVAGYDIRHDMNGIRSSLGLCPQHNIHFDYMSVEQHLVFFARVKGLSKSEGIQEANKYVEYLDLQSKRDAKPKQLSGGMKRKLSVAISLLANSKVLLLDEPTAALDPSARRMVWQVLEKHKEGRTILLITHFMDEADVLGDRIAILVNGKLKCCGSPFFLKKRYGTGYNLIQTQNSLLKPAQNYILHCPMRIRLNSRLHWSNLSQNLGD